MNIVYQDIHDFSRDALQCSITKPYTLHGTAIALWD